ncbi:uncharacterized protein C8Q71DRAFT_24090 [Rhodofomes roseus]|uniref:Uncharacterized protein n=1 Tax=Rhodofomes roseus TaxID=34475 RepID=A0ABQ8KXI1_9APHY|nr:uncharacterized protein C8Q71DRAFT_24090 [Rhodofomes roseus]KAH9844002.1 hypothetical protein C8Q71DRAFT_24090 [Rhodofomes roseus]
MILIWRRSRSRAVCLVSELLLSNQIARLLLHWNPLQPSSVASDSSLPSGTIPAMDITRPIHATSVPHTDGNASDGSIHADVSSAVPPHDATPDAGVTLTVGTAGAREEDGAHMHSTQKDYGISQPEKSGVAEPTVPSVEDATKRESLANPIPRDEPTIPMSRRFPTDSSSSRPSLGDRFSSITLAHASLQYFKDRAQSACKAYLPSPLRQSVLASSAQAEATAFDVGAIEAQGEALDAVSSSVTSSASGAWVKASTTVDAAGDASPRIHEDVVSSEAPLPAVPGSSGSGCLDDSALHTATIDEVPGRALSPAFDPVPFTLSEPQVEVPAVDLSPAPVSSSVAEFAASDSVSPLAPMEASPTICALSIIDAPSSALSAAPDPSLPAPSAEPDPSLSALSASLPTSLGSYPSAVLPCAAAPSAVLTVPAIIVSGPSDDAPAILADGHNASSELNEEPAVGEESNSPQAHFLEHACPSDSALSANATSAIPQAPAASHNLAPLGEDVAGVEGRDVDWRMSLAFGEAVEKNPHILIPDVIPVPPPIVSEDLNAASTLATDIAPAAAVQSCLSSPAMVFDFAGDPLATNALPDCSQAVHHLEMPSAVLEVTEDPEDTVLPGSTPNELSMLSNMPAVSSDGSTRSKSEGFSVVPAAGETVHGDKSTDETKAQKLEPVMASMSSLPQPKRPTLASQLRQRKKLIAPFRSPLVDKDAARHGIDAVYASGKSSTGLAATKREATEMPADSASTGAQAGSSLSQTVKDYPPSVAKQFKSPLHLGSSGPPAAAVSSVQAIPTIRALQAKIQTLKQAIRIKTASDGNDEEELDELVVKWTTVGREVAWAVWDTVKDLGPGETANIGKVGGGWFDDERGGRDGGHSSGWGFDDASQPAKGEMGEEGDGSGTKEGDDDAPGVQHTLGTMLRHLGIAPETLGWDEEEGDFVDVE